MLWGDARTRHGLAARRPVTSIVPLRRHFGTLLGQAGRTGIDPKPYVGDPTYDALQHMLNHPDRLATDPAGFVRRMAELLDLARSRLSDWLFARNVLESIDAPNLRAVAIALRP